MVGIEVGNSSSWRHQNPVCNLVAFLVLGRLARAYQVGSIATPPNRTAKSKTLLRKFAAHPAANTWRDTRIFFADCGFVFGTRVSHFGSNCLTNSASYGGEFEVAWPLRLCNRAIAETRTAMSATYALIAKSKGFTGSVQFLRDSHEYGLRKYRSWRGSTRAQHDCKGAKARGAQLREIA